VKNKRREGWEGMEVGKDKQAKKKEGGQKGMQIRGNEEKGRQRNGSGITGRRLMEMKEIRGKEEKEEEKWRKKGKQCFCQKGQGFVCNVLYCIDL